MKRSQLFTGALLLAIILIASCTKREAVDEFALRAQFVLGDVTVESAGKSRTPAVGETLAEGDVVKTGANSQLDLVYGSRGFLRLQENSILKVRDLKEKLGGNTAMDLDKGKVFVMVTKLTKGTEFGVKTPLTLAAVRGTSFRVSAEATTVRVDVVSGSVNVNPVQKGEVIKEVEATVETDKAVVITEQKVQEIVEKKRPLEVSVITPEVKEEIKQEVKVIPKEVIQKLAPDTSRELHRVLEIPIEGQIEQERKAEEDAKLRKKEEEEKSRREALAEKERRKNLEEAKRREKEESLRREREEKELAEKMAAEKAERERIAKEAEAKAKKEKEAKDRSSNVPTL